MPTTKKYDTKGKDMSRRLTIKETTNAMLGVNSDALKLSAKITIGNTLNDRVAAIVVPKLPMMVRGMALTNPEVTKAVLANIVSMTLINIAPTNQKAQLAAEAMVNSAMLNLVGSFNFEAMINEVIDGLDMSILGDTRTTFEQ